MSKIIVICALAGLVSCSLGPQSKLGSTRIPANAESTLRVETDGAWCWFGDPRALSNKEATYVTSINSEGYVSASKINHRTHIKTSYTFPKKLSVNDHNNPSIILLKDGNLVVFFSEHNGKAMFYSRTTKPGDMSSFERLRKITYPNLQNKGFTYPNPVLITDQGVEKLMLFWRGDDWTPTFSETSSLVSRWSTPKSFVKNGTHRPYVKYFADSKSRIHMTMTDGHPSVNPQNKIYYMYYKDGAFYKANHELIGTMKNAPFNLSQLDIIHRPTQSFAPGWTWSLAVDKNFNPLIAYSVSQSIQSHDYYVAQWNGKEWIKELVTSGGGSIQKENSHKREHFYAGGIFFDQLSPNRLYLSRQLENGNHSVEEWLQSAQDKPSYQFSKTVSFNSDRSFRPFVPVWSDSSKRKKSFKVLYMQGNYEYYTDYQTEILGLFSEKSF